MGKLSFTGFMDFAFVPYAPRSVKEALELDTDVVTTHNGLEDRAATRAVARQTYQYEFAAVDAKQQGPFNLFDQNIRGDWAVPVWSEAQKVGTVSGSTISCDTVISDFRVNGLVLVFRSNDIWELKQIASITYNQITLTSALSGTMQAAYVIPVNPATVKGDIRQQVSGSSTVYSLLYEMAQPLAHQTYMSVMFVLDHSDSMYGSRLTRMVDSVVDALTELRGSVVNSGLKLDLAICSWASTAVVNSWVNASADDLTAAIALVSALTVTSELFPDPNDAMTAAVTWFGTTAPHSKARLDYLFYVTGSNADASAAAATAADMLDGTAPFNGWRNIQMRSVVFTQDGQRELLTNWDHPDVTGGTGWSNQSQLGAASAETYGSFTNAYQIGNTGSGIRLHIDGAATDHSQLYNVRAWVKAGAGNTLGAKLRLRKEPSSTDSIISGAFNAPSVELEDAGPITNVSSTDLGGGVYLWSFDILVDASGDTVHPAVGTRATGNPVVIFAVSLRRAPDNNPDLTNALLLDNASGGAITVVSDDKPDALTELSYRAFAQSIGYNYEGLEIITDEPDGESLSKSITKIEDRIDFGGAFTTLSPWLYSRIMSSHSFPRDDLNSFRLLKEFFYRRLGKFRPVLLPTFQYDLHITAISLDGYTATCQQNDFRAYNSDRTRVAIQWADGYWQGLTIGAVTDIGGGQVTVTFNEVMVGGVTDIRQVCFMGEGRLDTDRMETTWVGHHATDTTMNMVEISK